MFIFEICTFKYYCILLIWDVYLLIYISLILDSDDNL